MLGYPLSLSNPSLTPLAYPFLTVINSLLTPISHFARSECTAAVDNRVGLCMPKSACLSSGGYVAGSCGFVLSCCVCKLPKIFCRNRIQTKYHFFLIFQIRAPVAPW